MVRLPGSPGSTHDPATEVLMPGAAGILCLFHLSITMTTRHRTSGVFNKSRDRSHTGAVSQATLLVLAHGRGWWPLAVGRSIRPLLGAVRFCPVCPSSSSRPAQAYCHGDGRGARVSKAWCAFPFQASAGLMFASIPLAKARHVIESKVRSEGPYRRHGYEIIFATCYFGYHL